MKHIVSSVLSAELFARFKRLGQAIGAPRAGLIRAAIEEFVERTLRENNDIRAKFERYTREDEESERKRLAAKSHLRLIK